MQFLVEHLHSSYYSIAWNKKHNFWWTADCLYHIVSLAKFSA